MSGDDRGGYDCVMPAAGESSRMGEWKLALPFRGATVLEWSVRNALVHCARVIVVTGFRAEEADKLLRNLPRVETVRNGRWASGMFSSIKSGVERVRTGRFFVALADMPMIAPEIFRRLAEEPHAGAVRPVYQGRKGHPVLLDRILIDRIRILDDSLTMGDVLRGASVRELPLASEYVTYDLDTMSDYDRLPREFID